VTESPFGSAGLLPRLRLARISADDVADAAEALLPGSSTGELRIRLAGPELELREREREVRVHLADLAADMTDAGVRATPEGIAAALTAWVASRPVTDAAAAAGGVAVVDWADAARTRLAWRVAVRRGDVAVGWTPSSAVDARFVHRVRSTAIGRSHDVPLDLRVEGPVALWSHRTVPLLATAALVAPERMIARTAAAGLDLAEMSVVVTPRRPVACAGAAVAARLAGETRESCGILPWRALADLPWA
jgi:hypothetical protein